MSQCTFYNIMKMRAVMCYLNESWYVSECALKVIMKMRAGMCPITPYMVSK